MGHLSRYNGSAWTEYVFDQQGNVAQRLNTSQVEQSSSAYDGYGVESSSGSPSDSFGYNAQWGYYLDRETGLYACMFRYYDPGQGRWLNRDPIGYAGGVNVYGYCGGSPVGRTDPTGHGWGAVLGGLAGGIIGFAVGGPAGAVAFGFAGAAYGRMAEGQDEFSSKIEGLADALSFALEPGAGFPGGRMPGRGRVPGNGYGLTDEICDFTFSHGPFDPRSTYRARANRATAKDPRAAQRFSPADLEKMKKGNNPTAVFPGNGQSYPMEWAHEGTPYAQGGTDIVLRTPWDHAANDPDRHWRP